MRTGARIKELRRALKLTQKQLADKVHVSSQVVSNWERGYSTPDSEDVKILASALDCSIDYLLGIEETSRRSDQDEFEALLNNPEEDQFYKEFKESPEERRKALLAAWEYLKSLEKK